MEYIRVITRRHFLKVGGGALAGGYLLALTGCGSTEGASTDGRQTIEVGVETSLTTGDPHMTGSPSDMAILINLFDPLVRRAEEGKLQPSLATSWDLVEEKAWEFKLRKGVKFHNGEEFNADTVKFSIGRIISEDSKSPIQELRSVDSVEVVDPTTVRIRTNVVDPFIPDKLALFGGMMVPPEYIAEEGEDGFSNRPVGTGPFSFKEWVRDDHLTVTANKDYWDGGPEVAEATFSFVPDSQSRVATLLSGNADIINQVPAVALKRIKSADDLRVDKAEGIRIFYLSTAYPEGPTSDKRVRQAISYAVDTQSLIDTFLAGNGVQIAAPVATTNFGSDVDLEPYPHNPGKAKQLLAQAGYADGFNIEMNTSSGIYTDISQAVVQMLGKVGINVNLNPLPDAEFEDRYSAGELAPLWNSGYSIWQGDPTTLIETFFHSGMPRAKYSSAELDRMIDEMMQETNADARREQLHDVLRVLHEDAPWTYLFQANDLYGVKRSVSWEVPTDQLLNLQTAAIEGSA